MIEPRRLDDFIGRWRISREMSHANAAPARFDGEGVWTSDENGALYRETGTLVMDGVAPMRSTRTYVWRGLDVYFDDGRFFHSVPPLGGNTRHWCDPDDYHVTYDFSQWPLFQTRWSVTGPRKDYVMLSHYRRVDAEHLNSASRDVS